MVEVAEILRAQGPEYLAKYCSRMPRAHLRAMRDIEQCRTPALGGQVYVCTKCDERRYSYHSCKNRHCPKCGNDQAEKWLEEQKELMLPVVYFLVTFTLPEELRRVARSNQKTVYSILFRASSEALQKLAWDERFVGGRVAMVGVLHTWTRALIYHPHVHYIVTGGGLSEKGEIARRFPGSSARAVGDLSRKVPRPAEEDGVVRSGGPSSMQERVGGALGASGYRRSSVQVSGAICVSGSDQQQPHIETRRWQGDL